METLHLSELESANYCATREMQLAHLKECPQVNLQWLFKTDNIEVARALTRKILTIPIIVMNGELCVGVGFLIKIEPASWKILNYIP
jgi:hypothetical protein